MFVCSRFTALAALAAAIILAVVGTLQAMKPDIAPALKEDATASMGGRRPARLRGALATVQITVSLLLVIGAALFVRSVGEAGAIDLGFDPRGVVVLDVDASAGRTNAGKPADVSRGASARRAVTGRHGCSRVLARAARQLDAAHSRERARTDRLGRRERVADGQLHGGQRALFRRRQNAARRGAGVRRNRRRG